jgi:hypothetical protein
VFVPRPPHALISCACSFWQVRCYLRLSDNSRAREALRQCLPDPLKDATFLQCLKDDALSKRWLSQLLHNLQEMPSGLAGSPQQAGPMLHGPPVPTSPLMRGNDGMM